MSNGKKHLKKQGEKESSFFGLKDKFENHYVVFGFSLIVLGFGAGWWAHYEFYKSDEKLSSGDNFQQGNIAQKQSIEDSMKKRGPKKLIRTNITTNDTFVYGSGDDFAVNCTDYSAIEYHIYLSRPTDSCSVQNCIADSVEKEYVCSNPTTIMGSATGTSLIGATGRHSRVSPKFYDLSSGANITKVWAQPFNE